MPDTVYIGYDKREDLAYKVCRYSIYKNAVVGKRHEAKIAMRPIVQDYLRAYDYYTRGIDARGSTDFSLTRFLVPELNMFNGYAIFMDCDFLITDDVIKLINDCKKRPEIGVWVVKHNHIPNENTK